MSEKMETAALLRSTVSPKVALLGSVSLLMAISSMMVLSLLPAFLVKVIGASALWVGTIEGAAEAAASFSKIFSGALSDWLQRRKPLVLTGYALSTIIKLAFPLAQSVTQVFLARVLDRVGKGVRDAPRDAFVADMIPDGVRGRGFGLRHALFSVGTLLGPLLAILCMWVTGDNFRVVYWIATIPAFAAVALLFWGVDEVAMIHDQVGAPIRFSAASLARLPRSFRHLLVFAAIVSFASLSPAFLLLKASSLDVDPAFAPLILVLVNSVNATAAYPIGILADRFGTRHLLVVGTFTLAASSVVFASSASVAGAAVGATLWGLQLAAMQALLSATIAASVPEDVRGTAFGLFDFFTGLAALAAGVLAGALWIWGGAFLTFGAGACFAGVALIALLRRMDSTK
jgi:MFS family permease